MIDFEAMSNPALLSQKVESSDYMQMIQDNGKKHELECWDDLRKKYEFPYCVASRHDELTQQNTNRLFAWRFLVCAF